MSRKPGHFLATISVAALFLGCRTVLPSDQPSRLWEVFEQQHGCSGSKAQVPRPTRMLRAEAEPCGQTVFIPPLR